MGRSSLTSISAGSCAPRRRTTESLVSLDGVKKEEETVQELTRIMKEDFLCEACHTGQSGRFDVRGQSSMMGGLVVTVFQHFANERNARNKLSKIVQHEKDEEPKVVVGKAWKDGQKKRRKPMTPRRTSE